MANRHSLSINWGEGDYPRDGRINLSDNPNSIVREHVRVHVNNGLTPESSRAQLFERNCFPLAKCRYFDKNNEQMAMDGSVTLDEVVRRDFRLFFHSLAGNDQDLIFTMKMRKIVAILLAGYNVLEQKGLRYSKGEVAHSIVFQRSDLNFDFPILTDYLEEKDDFVIPNRPHNYAYIKVLLESLIGNGRKFSPTVLSFLRTLTAAVPDYRCSLNHPALWRQDGGLKFANQACSYLRQHNLEDLPELLTGKPYHWKADLKDGGLDLYKNALKRGQKFLERQVEREGGRGGNVKFSYANSEVGKLRLKRDLYAHEKNEELDSIENMFEKSFPGFNSRIYNLLRRLGFEFEENPSWEEELPSL